MFSVIRSFFKKRFADDVPKAVFSKSVTNFDSATYWEDRYKKNGTSGFGSYGRLAEFKAQVINDFIIRNGICRLIELGCGDGNQLSMLVVDEYIGIDISTNIIEKCKSKFSSDQRKTFLTSAEFINSPLIADLTLSLDVIFHLVEDTVFNDYMRTLLATSRKYCIIYSSDTEAAQDPAVHVRHRRFSEWISVNAPDWCLIDVIPNKYPHDGSVNPKDLSFCNFYFYQRIK